MSIAKKLAYMPKARNLRRLREDKEEKEVKEELGKKSQIPLQQEHVSYTLDEEKMIDDYNNRNAPMSLDVAPDKTDNENAENSPMRTSEMNKSSSAMWLQMKMNRSPSKLNMQSLNGGGSNYTQVKAQMTSHDSRYQSNSSLPYKLPTKSINKNMIMIRNEEKENNQIVAIGGGMGFKKKTKDPFNEFMKSTRFATKPNSLVRQCANCQVLYSTSHVCVSIKKSNGNDAEMNNKHI